MGLPKPWGDFFPARFVRGFRGRGQRPAPGLDNLLAGAASHHRLETGNGFQKKKTHVVAYTLVYTAR